MGIMVPNQIGRYRVQDLLGKGGMGEAYRAFDPDLDREVALKIITLPGPDQNDEWRQRFEREVQVAACLNHPHIVTVYDVGLEHEPPYVVMELLTGGSLRERLKQGPIPWRETLMMLRPLGQALAYAHWAGVIHRDVKPGNIMFTGGETSSPFQGSSRGVLKLVDFGLARRQDDEQLTHSGAVFGTPAYMSPEQARGEEMDGRTDIFALGIILFEAITGRNPLDKGSTISTLLAAIAATPIDLSPLESKAPPAIIRLIGRAVTKDREQRYPTSEALLEDLDHCLGRTPDDLSGVPLTHVSTRPPIGPYVPTDRPIIQKGANIELTSEIEVVLQTMFSKFSRLAIEAEFGHGLSGGRVFRVRPVEAGGKAHLPTVVKIAPLNLIHQEWYAYQTWVTDTLPGIARLETASAHALPPGGLWSGLCYALVGGGVFEVQSLHAYSTRASISDVCWVLKERLYPLIGVYWWLERRPDRAFQMQTDYDSILPVNLLVKPAVIPAGTPLRRLTHQQLPTPALTKGDAVQLAGFVVTEIDSNRGQVTLKLQPGSPDLPSAAYRLRLVDLPNPENYRIGQIVDSLTGLVTATRHDLLLVEACRALGETVDLSTEPLRLSDSSSLNKGERALPNPLLVYQDMLQAFLTVNISTIHGDLSLENILVDPETRHINLIDFATVRQGHSLHDLLRLETEVVTKLIPPAMAEASLPPEAIVPFYEQLHYATVYPERLTTSHLAHPTLEKPFAMLVTIREMARKCLFNLDDWTEYYQGLTLYLLGALKFKNLDQLPTAPRPKQTAFWGAASVVKLLRYPPPLPAPSFPSKPLTARLIVGGVVLLLVVGLSMAFFLLKSPPSSNLIATIINVNPEVKIERTGSERLTEASFGTELYQSDILHTYVGASADIACANGLILRLPERQVMDVTCQVRGGFTEVAHLKPELSSQLVRSSEPISETVLPNERSSRVEQAQIPLLLDPRNTAVADTHPTFSWRPVEGAAGYRLLLTLPNGEVLTLETPGTRLSYPATAPPLEPGSAIIVELTTLEDETGQAVDKTLFSVLDEDSLAALADAEAAIQDLKLDTKAQAYLLAQLYRQYELKSAAIDQLKQLVEAPQALAANLWQQLGDLYFEVGLYLLAEDSYHQALTAAKQGEDLSAQAAAQVGLAHTALTFDETEAAIKQLQTAAVLYQQAGQPDLAKAIAIERDQLTGK
jgi:serine/threonine protein kinase